MATERSYTVRFATRHVTFESVQVKDRGHLAKLVRCGEVIKVKRGARLSRLNLALVEEIL